MRVVGLFRETDGRDASIELPSMLAAAGLLAEADRVAVLDHLSRGAVVVDSMEASQDPFRPAQYLPGGSSLVTDGTWVWRLDLAHFVREYGVEVEPAFVAHVRAQPAVPQKDELLLMWKDVVRAYAEARGLGEME